MATALDLTRIIHDNLGSSNYFRKEQPKKQIYIHNSFSHPSPIYLVNEWRRREAKVGACAIIAGKPYEEENYYADGDIYQCFPAKYWAMHLGIQAKNNQAPPQFKNIKHSRYLEKSSIAIYLCNAGPLSYEGGKFYSSFGTIVPDDDVIEFTDKFRGNQYYQKYTTAQLESLGQILSFLSGKFKIPSDYKSEMWDISTNALNGVPGIYTSASVRTDKPGCHPQPALVNMLKNL